MKRLSYFFAFITIFSSIAIAMEDHDLKIHSRSGSGGTLIEITNKEGKNLTELPISNKKEDVTNIFEMSQFAIKEADQFHRQMTQIIEANLENNSSKFIFIDLHGVLQSIEWECQGQEFRFIPNCFFNAVISHKLYEAISTMEADTINALYETLIKIKGLKSSEVFEKVLSDKVLALSQFFIDISWYFLENPNLFSETITVKYKPVDENIKTILETAKKRQANIFVLSAFPYSPKTHEFLNEYYPGIFSEEEKRTEEKKAVFDQLINTKPKLATYMKFNPKCSYIYTSTNKYHFILACETMKGYSVFIDDNLGNVQECETAILNVRNLPINRFSHHSNNHALVYYPLWLKNVDVDQIKSEIIAFFNIGEPLYKLGQMVRK